MRRVLLLLPAALLGCATGRATTALPGGVTVHTFRFSHANSHLVVHGDSAVLIDSGLERDAEALVEAMREEGFDPSRLRAVIVSHGHADHAGGASYLKRTFGTKIIAGRGDLHMLASGKNDAVACPTGWLARRRVESDVGQTYTPFEADTVLDGPTELAPLVGIPGRIEPLPGHSPGTVVVILPAANAAFVGDLFRGAIVGSSAERHFYMCDLADNDADIAHLVKELGPGVTRYFPGHLGPVSRESVIDRFEVP